MSESKPNIEKVEIIETESYLITFSAMDAARALMNEIKNPGSFCGEIIVPTLTDALIGKPRKKRSTKVNPNAVTEYYAELMSQGFTRVQALARIDAKYGIHPRTVERYIKKSADK